MSLFKTKDLWSAHCRSESSLPNDFDIGCLQVTNQSINPSSQRSRIIISSLNGRLWLFEPPMFDTAVAAASSDSTATCLLLEHNFGEPVLQIIVDKVVAVSNAEQLVVLHPRRLSIYDIVPNEGSSNIGSHYQLSLLYEHKLSRIAFNMCTGFFGGVTECSHIAVQSVDCTLSIFEQDTFAFSRFLPNSLLPGPICFEHSTDSFITSTSSWTIDSYALQVLAVAPNAKSREESSSMGKKVVANWSANVGERIVDIRIWQKTIATPIIMGLGWRTVFCFETSGAVLFMKKLDFSAVCFDLLKRPGEYVIGSDAQALHLFNRVDLRWASHCSSQMVALCVANIGGVRGCLVTLGSSGDVTCSVLGTDPSLYIPSVGASSRTAQSIDVLDDSYNDIMRKVKDRIRKENILDKASSLNDDEVSISISPSKDLSYDSSTNGFMGHSSFKPIPNLSIGVSLSIKTKAENIKLSISKSRAIDCTEQIKIPIIDHLKAFSATFIVSPSMPFPPASNLLTVAATYVKEGDVNRCVTKSMFLPLKLFCFAIAPIKSQLIKVTIDTNKPAFNLLEIYNDLLGSDDGCSPNAVGLRFYHSEQQVTILASKTSERYRLQSDNIGHVHLIAQDLVYRLRSRFGDSSFKVSYSTDALPVDQVCESIDTLLSLRRGREAKMSNVDVKSRQVRATQKALLVKMRDKTPSDITHFERLFTQSLSDVKALGDELIAIDSCLVEAEENFSSALRLFAFLAMLWQSYSSEEHARLMKVLVVDGASPERLESSLRAFLKSISDSEHLFMSSNAETAVKDSTTLKKFLLVLVEKMESGCVRRRLTGGGGDKADISPRIRMSDSTTSSDTNAFNKFKKQRGGDNHLNNQTRPSNLANFSITEETTFELGS